MILMMTTIEDDVFPPLLIILLLKGLVVKYFLNEFIFVEVILIKIEDR